MHNKDKVILTEVFEMSLGLLLIDIQNDYFQGGKFELYQSEQAANQAKKMLQLFRAHNLPVFHIQHINHSPNAPFFVSNTEGANIHKSVSPKNGEIVIEKHTPDSFYQTTLKSELDKKGINHLVVCGMMTHMCVDTTVRAAVSLGYKITLIEDACATRELEWNNIVVPAPIVQAAFMASLNNKFANILSVDKWTF